MSKNYQGILGPQIGKVGPVVAYRWKGRDVYRGYVRYTKNPRTAKQLLNRAKFTLMADFARALSAAVNRGYKYMGESLKVTPRNVFSQKNMQHISGATPDALNIRYEDVELSDGPLTPVSGGTTHYEDGTLTFTPSDSGQYGCYDNDLDKVMCVVYNPTKGLSKLASASREVAHETGIEVAIPDTWSGDKVEVYAFAYTTTEEPIIYEDYQGTVYPGMASKTVFVDEVTIA